MAVQVELRDLFIDKALPILNPVSNLTALNAIPTTNLLPDTICHVISEKALYTWDTMVWKPLVEGGLPREDSAIVDGVGEEPDTYVNVAAAIVSSKPNIRVIANCIETADWAPAIDTYISVDNNVRIDCGPYRCNMASCNNVLVSGTNLENSIITSTRIAPATLPFFYNNTSKTQILFNLKFDNSGTTSSSGLSGSGVSTDLIVQNVKYITTDAVGATDQLVFSANNSSANNLEIVGSSQNSTFALSVTAGSVNNLKLSGTFNDDSSIEVNSLTGYIDNVLCDMTDYGGFAGIDLRVVGVGGRITNVSSSFTNAYNLSINSGFVYLNNLTDIRSFSVAVAATPNKNCIMGCSANAFFGDPADLATYTRIGNNSVIGNSYITEIPEDTLFGLFDAVIDGTTYSTINSAVAAGKSKLLQLVDTTETTNTTLPTSFLLCVANTTLNLGNNSFSLSGAEASANIFGLNKSKSKISTNYSAANTLFGSSASPNILDLNNLTLDLGSTGLSGADTINLCSSFLTLKMQKCSVLNAPCTVNIRPASNESFIKDCEFVGRSSGDRFAILMQTKTGCIDNLKFSGTFDADNNYIGFAENEGTISNILFDFADPSIKMIFIAKDLTIQNIYSEDLSVRPYDIRAEGSCNLINCKNIDDLSWSNTSSLTGSSIIGCDAATKSGTADYTQIRKIGNNSAIGNDYITAESQIPYYDAEVDGVGGSDNKYAKLSLVPPGKKFIKVSASYSETGNISMSNDFLVYVNPGVTVALGTSVFSVGAFNLNLFGFQTSSSIITSAQTSGGLPFIANASGNMTVRTENIQIDLSGMAANVGFNTLTDTSRVKASNTRFVLGNVANTIYLTANNAYMLNCIVFGGGSSCSGGVFLTNRARMEFTTFNGVFSTTNDSLTSQNSTVSFVNFAFTSAPATPGFQFRARNSNVSNVTATGADYYSILIEISCTIQNCHNAYDISHVSGTPSVIYISESDASNSNLNAPITGVTTYRAGNNAAIGNDYISNDFSYYGECTTLVGPGLAYTEINQALTAGHTGILVVGDTTETDNCAITQSTIIKIIQATITFNQDKAFTRTFFGTDALLVQGISKLNSKIVFSASSGTLVDCFGQPGGSAFTLLRDIETQCIAADNTSNFNVFVGNTDGQINIEQMVVSLGNCHNQAWVPGDFSTVKDLTFIGGGSNCHLSLDTEDDGSDLLDNIDIKGTFTTTGVGIAIGNAISATAVETLNNINIDLDSPTTVAQIYYKDGTVSNINANCTLNVYPNGKYSLINVKDMALLTYNSVYTTVAGASIIGCVAAAVSGTPSPAIPLKSGNNSVIGNDYATPAGTETLTNKTLDNTNTITLKDTLFTLQDDGDTSKQAKFQLSGIAPSNTRVMTLPDSNTTLVGVDVTQTLTNKTISGASNTITNIPTTSISGPFIGGGWSMLIQVVANNTFTLVAYAGCDGEILGVGELARALTTAGTFAIKINGTDVTSLTAVVPTTSGSYTAATGASTFVRGDKITITYTGTTAVLDHSILIDYSQTL